MNAFVYGTLMIDAIFNKVVFGENNMPNIHFKKSKAVLKGYKRFIAPNRDYPAILPVTSHPEEYQVEGILIEGLLKPHIEALDYFEGPEYKRVPLLITILNENSTSEKTVYTDAYLWKDELNEDTLLNLPIWDFENFKTNELESWLNKRENFEWD